MEVQSITLTLTPDEARRVLLAIKGHVAHLATLDHMTSGRIRDTYRDMARMLEAQIEAQGGYYG